MSVFSNVLKAKGWYSLHQHLFVFASVNIELNLLFVVSFILVILLCKYSSLCIDCMNWFLYLIKVYTVSARSNFESVSFPIKLIEIILNMQFRFGHFSHEEKNHDANFYRDKITPFFYVFCGNLSCTLINNN